MQYEEGATWRPTSAQEQADFGTTPVPDHPGYLSPSPGALWQAGWVNRTLDDDELNSFVDALVRRLTSFDREALAAAKAEINRYGMPTAAELQSSNEMFFPTLAWPTAQARRAKIRNVGYGVPSDFELNFGRYLPALGRADDDSTDRQPD